MSLADLFPGEDYRFHMRMERGRPEEFFAVTPEHDSVMAERCHWLRSEPAMCCAWRSQCEPLLDEAIAALRDWRVLPEHDAAKLTSMESAQERCMALGRILEPDFLLLKADASGQFQLLGGCVCFPSSWNLAEKIGQPLETIHGVVPGLNSQIGKSIQTFLGKLSPGVAWRRHNWGLNRSPELNQHPGRNLPRLTGSARLDEVWLRVEHQALLALPLNSGVLFGIRIAVHPLTELKKDATAAQRLIHALRTMPEEMAAYKNIAVIRHALAELLVSRH